MSTATAPAGSTVIDDEQLAATAAAFDGVASTYDGPQGNNVLIQRMRDIVHARIDALVTPRSTVLDIGCGTGLDAQHYAERGHRVIATDWSPAMVARAAERAATTGLPIDARRGGAHELDRLDVERGSIDLAWSNFGPLNCVPDLGATAAALARHVRPGGHVVASVIGRWCPWEVVHYARRRRWQRVAVRFLRRPTPVGMAGGTIWTRYHTPGEFTREWRRGAPGEWDVVGLETLSLFVPPPYLEAQALARPDRLVRQARWDDRVGAWPVVRAFGDHFLVTLRRR
ncbi:MAG: class I SAM-dependent methyltransferase [Actinomycetes bacterium]